MSRQTNLFGVAVRGSAASEMMYVDTASLPGTGIRFSYVSLDPTNILTRTIVDRNHTESHPELGISEMSTTCAKIRSVAHQSSVHHL